MRIPGWAREEPVPGDLYRFLDTAPPATLKVNGAPMPLTIDKGYVRIARAWKAGDVIELDLPMPVRRVVAHEKVTDDAGRVALQRGPIVYAAEWPDHPGGRVRNLVLPDASQLTADVPARAAERRDGPAGTRARPRNRQPRRGDRDRPAAHRDSLRDVGQPRSGRDDRLAAAHRRRRASDAVADAGHDRDAHRLGAGVGPRQEPAADHRRRGAAHRPTIRPSYFDWWPTRGSGAEWVEMTFAKPATISESSVFWFDDTGRGSVRVPASWRILYKDAAGDVDAGQRVEPVRRRPATASTA